MFRFRVLLEQDSDYNVFVARCLETGGITTADDSETAKDMMQELLMDEVIYALEHRDLANLYSSPAPYDVWTRCRNAERDGTPSKPMRKAVRARNEEEVPAEIQFSALT